MIGQILLWSVALELVAAVPAGLVGAVLAIRAPSYRFNGPADRAFQILGGLAMAGAAASLIHQFGPAFVAVALR